MENHSYIMHFSQYPILYDDCRHVMPQQVSDIECSYNDLESMLGAHTWFGGAWPTLSDITIAATVSTLNVMVPINSTRYLFYSTN